MPDHTLVLLRHAKSDWSGGEPDHDRPLAPRGRRQAPEAGRWLAGHLARVDLAVTSSAVRAVETWELTSSALAVPPLCRVEGELYGASADELLEAAAGLDEDLGTVVLVAHNPGMEELASYLAGQEVSMPTAALAVFDVTGSWMSTAPASVVLRAAGRPPHE